MISTGFHRSTLAKLVALIASFGLPHAMARDYFNPDLLETDGQQQAGSNLEAFEEGSQAAGVYRVDIYLDEQLIDTRDTRFERVLNPAGDSALQPCLQLEQLKMYGVKTDLFPGLGSKGECVDLSAIPQASAEFIFSSQKLILSFPQAALSHRPRGYVSPDQWDEGISAVLLNYSVSGSDTSARNSQGSNDQSYYANLRPGVNMGPWRLRNYTTWSRSNDGEDKWSTVYTYLQRDIQSLRSQFILGDNTSPADIFESVPFRGAQAFSDDDMLPESQKGYAPVIRGIARTNAQITIRQNGYVIYQSYVAPGAFTITDMYPTGGSGDLNVTIKESDGSEQHQIVPFASLPVLQRPGFLKYSLTAGQYRSYDNSVKKTPFGQLTGIYGLPWGLTVYGGVQTADPYKSLALGVGKNLGHFGAFSLDVTQAKSQPKGRDEKQGQSYRARYSKNITEIGTNFTIAGYRYSTSGYYSLQEVMETYSNHRYAYLNERRRNRAEMTLSQNLWENAGALSLSIIKEDYWGSNKTTQSVGAGYSNGWKGISYSVNYSYNKNSYGNGGLGGKVYETDHLFALNINVPFDFMTRQAYVNYSLSTSKDGNTTNQVGINGSALEERNLNWNLQQGYANQGQGNSGNMNANYKGTYGEVNTGYGYDSNSRRVDYGASGGVLIHENGLTLSQQLGETVVLVKAPGAAGVGVNNQTGVNTDYRGYTVSPYATPYRKNEVTLDTATLPNNVDLSLNSTTVVPTRGAVVRADFDTKVGRRVLMTLLRQGGGKVPFGAIVTDLESKGTQGFIVGDSGQVYLTGISNEGTLLAQWGRENNTQCRIKYALPENNAATGIVSIQAWCQ